MEKHTVAYAVTIQSKNVPIKLGSNPTEVDRQLEQQQEAPQPTAPTVTESLNGIAQLEYWPPVMALLT